MHPHSPQLYVQLFKDAYKLKSISRISKDKAGLFGSVSHYDEAKRTSSPLTGDLYRFSVINLEGDWFNIQTNQNAEENELVGIKIPEHLKPNSSRFSYLFFPESHVLFYESYYDGHSLGNHSVLKLIEGILNKAELNEKYGIVDVTVIPSKEKLSEALNIARMDKLVMEIKRPNPDDLKKAERKVFERLDSQSIAKYSQELVAIPGTSISPDSETKTLAHIAAKNGSVAVKGRDLSDHPVEYTTVNHPWEHTEYYDPKIENAYNTFTNTVFQFREEVENWIKDDE